jgi:hypothetical protein
VDISLPITAVQKTTGPLDQGAALRANDRRRDGASVS